VKLRFLAAAGHPEDRLRLERAAGLGAGDGLVRAQESRMLSLWTPSGTPTISGEEGNRALVGLLFDRASANRLTQLPVVNDDPARFVRDHWGAYAMFADRAGGHSALRDPSGSVPIYYGPAGALDIYASDADLLLRALPNPPRPDLDFIRHWLSFPFLRSHRTGIDGVRELLPGMWRRRDDAGERLVEAWSPFAFARADSAICGFDEAAARLREDALRTIPLLVPPGEETLLQLSGGLDSSIVAAALRHAGAPFRAVNFATRSADGDERDYARAVASHCRVELAEMVEGRAAPDLGGSIAGPLRPPPNPLLQPVHRASRLHFAATGPGLVLDGAGGDNVFAWLNTPVPALDALRRKGPATALAALRDVAELHGCTVWTAARLAVRKALRGHGRRWRSDTSFLAEGAVMVDPDLHPWLQPPPGIVQGKADHVRMIVGIHHFLFDPWPGAPAVLHPLLAQPLLETCLRIPTWLWVQDGRDRAVARAAFADLLPERIIERRGKGRLETMFLKGYRALRPRLEAFLLDGGLAARGIIDREAVGAFLRSEQPPEGRHIRLLEIVAAEQWLRSFAS